MSKGRVEGISKLAFTFEPRWRNLFELVIGLYRISIGDIRYSKYVNIINRTVLPVSIPKKCSLPLPLVLNERW